MSLRSVCLVHDISEKFLKEWKNGWLSEEAESVG